MRVLDSLGKGNGLYDFYFQVTRRKPVQVISDLSETLVGKLSMAAVDFDSDLCKVTVCICLGCPKCTNGIFKQVYAHLGRLCKWTKFWITMKMELAFQSLVASTPGILEPCQLQQVWENLLLSILICNCAIPWVLAMVGTLIDQPLVFLPFCLALFRTD